ncbi:MAG: hypothetical protein WDN06_15190 [Asticcacaulis sp.]
MELRPQRRSEPAGLLLCPCRRLHSGAAFIIRKALWNELDGFDSHFRPAYYEDTDLAFRVRAAGHAVIFQPQSKIVHYEGKTSGTDEGSGAKAYQAVNKDKFFARWRDTLKDHRANGDKPSLERDRTVTRRVLIIDACNPTPGQDAGSKATLDLMRYYQTLGYHVSFVPEDNFLYQRAEVSAMQAMGIECFYAPLRKLDDAVAARQWPAVRRGPPDPRQCRLQQHRPRPPSCAAGPAVLPQRRPALPAHAAPGFAGG